jgi:hypothetical protein
VTAPAEEKAAPSAPMTFARERLIEYTPSRYTLASCIAATLGEAPHVVERFGFSALDLAMLHEYQPAYALFSRENDQSTTWHRLFYRGFAEHVEAAYFRLVAEVIRKRYREPIAYQRIPTFRVHLPGNVAVGEFHRDRDYGHSPHEENYWLPLTRAWGTNTIWIESAPDREDYQPVALSYGQILLFDGANLKHGNQVNTTERTRVSMDFRVVPLSKYEDSDRKTINTGMRFAIGGYFSLMP